MSDASDCVFCKIIEGKIPGRIIEQNADAIVFVSLENHPLVVTRKHIEDIFSLTDELGAAVMREAIRIAKAMRTALNPDGIHLAQSNGAAAGQEVFHYHLHLYPRWSDRAAPEATPGNMDHMLASLKAALPKV